MLPLYKQPGRGIIPLALAQCHHPWHSPLIVERFFHTAPRIFNSRFHWLAGPSVGPPVRRSVPPSVGPSVGPSVRPSIRPSVRQKSRNLSKQKITQALNFFSFFFFFKEKSCTTYLLTYLPSYVTEVTVVTVVTVMSREKNHTTSSHKKKIMQPSDSIYSSG